MQVFISYSIAIDQLVALRLQTLATVYGMTVYVPPASSREGFAASLSQEVEEKLRASDVVLAVMMHTPSTAAVNEMNAAIAARKILIPIVSPTVSPAYYSGFPHFLLDLADPSKTESAIIKFLNQQLQPRSTTAELVALTTLTLGLLLFSAEAK